MNKVATIAEECWSYIISQGFKRPPGVPETGPITDPEKKVQLRIEDLSSEGGEGIYIYGDCSIVGKNSSTPPTIRIDNNYLASEYPIWNGDNALRTTLIHEFFHAVQQSYANKVSFSPILFWFWEGTAAWIEDEPATLLGVNIDTLNHYNVLSNRAKLFMNTPEKSLTSRSYDAVLFYKYLTEQKGVDKIKTILQNYDLGNYTTANNSDMLKAIGQALGDPAPDYFGDNFKTLFENFTVACYMKTGTYGFTDDGASGLPDIALTQTTSLSPGELLSFSSYKVNSWAADYFKITPDPSIYNLLFDFDGEGGEIFSNFTDIQILLIKNNQLMGGPITGKPDPFNNVKFPLITNLYDYFVVVVGGASRGGSYNLELSSLNILYPKQSYPVNVGPKDKPNKINVKIKWPHKGLKKNEFYVEIGGKEASILTLTHWEDANVYALELMPPVQDNDGLYDLMVKVKADAILDTEKSAICYGQEAKNVDAVLVIDRSGSMGDEDKIESAKSAAKLFVDFMEVKS